MTERPRLEDIDWRFKTIRPCPFCGRVPVLITADMNNEVGCDREGCGFAVVMSGDPGRCIDYWNRLAVRE